MSVCMNVREFVDCVHGVYRWVCVWMWESLREFLDCVHGVCEWMEGHNVNRLYIVTCDCMNDCETFIT